MRSLAATLLVVALTGLAGLGPARFAQASDCLLGMALPQGYRPFTKDSPWNVPIADDAKTAPDSDAMIRALARRAPHFSAALAKWTPPLFVINAAACPQVELPTRSDMLHPSVDPDGDGKATVPMPEGVWPDPTEDGHLLLVDPTAQKSWEFSAIRLVAGKPVSASRIFVWDLGGQGFREPFSGDGWWTVGASASGLPFVGGLITPDEFTAGVINHALLCALPTTRKSEVPGDPLELCRPAARTDGRSYGAESIPMGARLQLDPTLDPAALGIARDLWPVVRAMQRYGLIVTDSGQSFKTYFQNLGPDRSLWNANHIVEELGKIPVTAFRVLDCTLVRKGQ